MLKGSMVLHREIAETDVPVNYFRAHERVMPRCGMMGGDKLGIQMARSFKDIATEYCAWVEKREVREDVGIWLSQILAELILEAYRIPDDELADAGASEENRYKARDYQEVRASLPELPIQYYREVFDNLDLESDEAVMGDLHDDVADIYRELKEGLFIYEHDSPSKAERFWRQLFRYHWGEHATGALRALYWHVRNKE
jgi:hypothetical protein